MAGKQKVYDEAMAMAASFSWDQNWADAVKSYRAALTEFPEDSAAFAGLGTAYFELAQYESAIRVFQRALKAEPNNLDILDKIGESLEKLGRLEDAAKTYVYNGNVRAKQGQVNDAIAVWERAVQLNPDLTQARNNLAQAYARTGKPNEAVAELITLAAIFQEQNDPQKAAQCLKGGAQIDRNNRYLQAAQQALENGTSIRAARLEFEEQPAFTHDLTFPAEDSLEEDPFSFDAADEAEDDKAHSPRQKAELLAMEELANVLFEDASQYANQLKTSKTQIDGLISQAIDWQTRENVPKAIETYEKIIASGFTHSGTFFKLACLYLDSNQPDKAIKYFNQAKKEKTYFLGANFALGECYRALDDVNQALTYLIEVLKITDLTRSDRTSTQELNQLYLAVQENYTNHDNPESVRRFVNTLIDLLSGKDWENQIVQARQRLGVGDDTQVSAWIEFLEAGQTEIILSAMANTAEYIRQNMLMTAAEACYWAVQHVPNYLPLHMRLAEIYLKQGRIENGINKYLSVADVYQIRGNMSQVAAIYQRVLAVAPMDVTVRSKLIELNSTLGDFDAAMEHYQILADAYYQLAQVDKALEVYQASLELAPKTPDPKRWQVNILSIMGDIYNQRVDWRSAVHVYEQLRQIAPEDARMMAQLVELYFKLNQRQQATEVLDHLISHHQETQNQQTIIQILRNLVELRPQEMQIRQRLADFYVILGMRQEALEHYNVLGEMQLDAGLPDSAAQTIEKIIELGPDDLDAYRKLLAQIRGGVM